VTTGLSDQDQPAEVLALVQRLRSAGLALSVEDSSRFVEALATAPDAQLRDVAMATLARGPDDVAVIDAVLGGAATGGTTPRASRPMAGAMVRDDRAGRMPASTERGPHRSEFSAREILRSRDLRLWSDDERAEIRHMLTHVPLVGDRHRTRRRRPSGRRGLLDLRATVRTSLRSDGELLRLHRRAHRVRTRQIVLLLDVSGSMEPYSRAMLQLAHVGAVGRGRVDVFALGTRLTRLTRVLAWRDPDVALRTAAHTATDWGGGTRLGETLRALNDDPTYRGLVRGATVVVVSDGLDRGDADVLRAQIERLARVAHRLIWVNPLRASDGYEPRAAGMRVALPFVDHFVEGHSIEALEELAALVARPPGRR
jgi:uncharacterized protein with von Willebrand factor type A (vWA) domain